MLTTHYCRGRLPLKYWSGNWLICKSFSGDDNFKTSFLIINADKHIMIKL